MISQQVDKIGGNPPADNLIGLSLVDIGLLSLGSRQFKTVEYLGQACTVTFWFWAESFGKKQVIANHGNELPQQAGWSVFIEDGQVHLEITSLSGSRECVSAAIEVGNGWLHFAGIIDQASSTLKFYLDGQIVADAYFKRDQNSLISSEKLEGSLKLGGFTDPAGGHFEYTFGRKSSGLLDDFRLYRRELEPSEIASFQRPLCECATTGITVVTDGDAPTRVKLCANVSDDEESSVLYFVWEVDGRDVYYGKTVSFDAPYADRYCIKLFVVGFDHRMTTHQTFIDLEGLQNPIKFSSVFRNGENGIAGYRIPTIIKAANGDLLAFAEGRVDTVSDSAKMQRIVCKRSKDNGETWGKLQIVAKNIVDGEEFACQEPSPVVDIVHGSGKIILVFIRNETNEWALIEGKGVRRVCCKFSDDHGETWYGDRDITLQVHKPYCPDYLYRYANAAPSENRQVNWFKTIPTRGHGIQLQQKTEGKDLRGRLLYAGNISRGEKDLFSSECYVFWSDDLGDTWEIGGILEEPRENGRSAKGLNEAMAVELDGGGIIVNARNYDGSNPVGKRAVARGHFDEDGAIHFAPITEDPTLIEPPCQASITRYTFSDEIELGGKSRVLFSNPAHENDRINLTVRMSYDDGETWPVSKVIDAGPSSYSDLVVMDDHSIGVFYERGNQGGLWFARFAAEWLTDGADVFTGFSKNQI